MLEFPRWKYFLIALIVLTSALYALPNVFPHDPALQIAPSQGGPVDEAVATKVRGLLEAQKIAYTSAAVEGDDLIVRLADTDAQARASDVVRLDKALADYTVALNLAPTVPAWLTWLGAKPMTLGLDLQGGVHFLMEVDQTAAREKRENAYVEEVQVLLRDNDIRYTGVGRDPTGIIANLRDDADKAKATTLLQTNLPRLTVVDSPAATLRLQLLPEEAKKIADDAIEQNIVALRNRVASLAEPVIQRQGTSRIIVEMPGIQDVAAAKKLIGGTDTLEWRAVVEGNALTAQESGVVPPDARLYFERPATPGAPRNPVLLSKRLIVGGEQLIDAQPGVDQRDGSPMVSIKLDSAGGKRMSKHTIDNVGKPMAIVYIKRIPTTTPDPVTGEPVAGSKVTEEVISIANIREPFGANFQTSGLEPEEAKQLSAQIKAGALAAPMVFAQERVVGPSLGAENVRRGMQAVLYAFLFVMVFFVIYYKTFGVVTNLALLLNLLLVVALMSVFGATLTLPGFAGIALTVGMSVDANVLINERIREELRLGVSPLAAIAAGYDKASGTIADANVTALLGGLAMAAFGSGPIRGFGITLVIGILTSMYTAVEVSRGIATLIYGKRRKLAGLSI